MFPSKRKHNIRIGFYLSLEHIIKKQSIFFSKTILNIMKKRKEKLKKYKLEIMKKTFDYNQKDNIIIYSSV